MDQQFVVREESFVQLFIKGLLCALLIFFDIDLLSASAPWILLDYINLYLHQTGQFLFSYFGNFLHAFGGSLTQCLVPLICLLFFAVKRSFFYTGISLFWLGNNLIFLSIYIKDAQTLQLPALGGIEISSDLHYVLSELQMLEKNQEIAEVMFGIGAFCVVIGTGFALIAAFKALLHKFSPAF